MGLVFWFLCRTVCLAVNNVFEMMILTLKSRPVRSASARSGDFFSVTDMRENHRILVADIQPKLNEVNLLLCSD